MKFHNIDNEAGWLAYSDLRKAILGEHLADNGAGTPAELRGALGEHFRQLNAKGQALAEKLSRERRAEMDYDMDR
ncbi:hypothetical protein [Aeoliella sp.]|uniref:hypothetical protein n=1 Tax=Aeoliella sp. TaxID=2795800 RepID=UPI003CCC337F